MEALSSSFTHPPSSLKNYVIKFRPPSTKINAKLLQRSHSTSQTHETTLTNPKKPGALVSTIFHKIDNFICTFLDSPLRPGIDPKHVLSDNSAPVQGELPPTPCQVVVGPIPSCFLGGAYIRNGPNPQFTPSGPYHLFDGDGMLHMIKFSGSGEVAFCSRYVKTHKHTVESEIGHNVVLSPFASMNGLPASAARLLLAAARVITGQFDPRSQGFGSANTSLVLFPGAGGGLCALCESDLPYGVRVTRDGDIITLRRQDFLSSDPSFSSMTAHPKIDRRTGETFAYRYGITPPYLTFFRIDPDGIKQGDVPIKSLEESAIVHDFAVTENYAVFPNTQISVNPWFLKGKPLIGVDLAKVPRIGVIPRYAEDESEMWWADAPGLNICHCFNAWEEDGGATIVVVASIAVEVVELLERMDFARLRLEKITIDVKTKTVKSQSLSTNNLEFGAINPAYAGKKNR